MILFVCLHFLKCNFKCESVFMYCLIAQTKVRKAQLNVTVNSVLQLYASGSVAYL